MQTSLSPISQVPLTAEKGSALIIGVKFKGKMDESTDDIFVSKM